MESVTQIEDHVRSILGPGADQVARESGFIRRERQVSGATFAQGLIFGWMHPPEARLEQLSQALGRAGASLSAPGLSQRFPPEAVAFLETVCQHLSQLAVRVEPAELALLKRFSAVIVEDSSQISLPDELRRHWKGCGNGAKSQQAGLQLPVQWDLLSAQLWGPVLSDGTLSEQRSPLRQDPAMIPAGAVYVTDNGSFGLAWLQAHACAGRYALTRPRANTAFCDVRGQRLDLREIGPKPVGATLDMPVVVGAQVRWLARLIMVRVPEDVAEQRQERIKRTAQRHRRHVVSPGD